MTVEMRWNDDRYEGYAALPPKRERKLYALEQESTGEHVLTRIGKNGDSVVGVFQPTMSDYSAGNISGVSASIRLRGRSVQITVEEK